MIRLPLLLAITLAACSTAEGNGPADQRALFDQHLARQRLFEVQKFSSAGFTTMRIPGEEARRVLFSDPYGMISIPGIEIRRDATGVVTLQLVSRDGVEAPVPLPATAWEELSEYEADAFRRPDYVASPKRSSATPVAPPPICHGWLARLSSEGSVGLRTASWSECGGKADARKSFAVEAIRLALIAKPTCVFDVASPFWSYTKCFSPPREG